MNKQLKVLIINGSPRVGGNTSVALREMETVFNEQGVETEIVQIGAEPVRGCASCGYCYEHDRCVFDDVVNTLAPTALSLQVPCTLQTQTRRSSPAWTGCFTARALTRP